MLENDRKDEVMEDSVIECEQNKISDSTSGVEELTPIHSERLLRKKKKTPEEDSQPTSSFRKGRLDLSLKEKVKILEMLDANPRLSQRRISGTFNVSQSQISRIKNNKNSIMKEWQNGNCERKRKRIGKGGDVLEKKLLQWYNKAKHDCIPLSGPLLMEKAKEIALEQQIRFTPTSGWFGRWKARHSITLKGKKLNKDASMSYSKLCHHWRRYTFAKLTKNFNAEAIWFLGHTNLYYNATVSNVRELNDNRFDQRLKNINLLLAFNSNGVHRRKPLVIGKEKINIDELPVFYYDSSESQITKEIFSNWLVEWDNELKSCKMSIIVFIQKSCYTPDNLRLNCITLHYYPEGKSNEPLQIQPFNKSVASLFNSLYRYQIIAENRTNEQLKAQMIASSDKIGDFIDSISKSFPVDINLSDALFMIRRSWEHLNPDILVQGVVRAGLSKEVHACSTDGFISAPPLLTDEDFNALVNFESLANTKSLSVVSDNVSNDGVKGAFPTTVEVLMACQVLKKFMQKKCTNQLDRFAEIETNLQDCIFKDGKTCSNSHPLYSTKSVHSFHGHKNTLNKRLSTFKMVTEQALNHSTGNILPYRDVCHPDHVSNSYDCQNGSFNNHHLQLSSGVLQPTKYISEFQQYSNSYQSTDYIASSPRRQSNMELKIVPIVGPRVTANNMDPGWASLQQQPRTLQNLNPDIIPGSDSNNRASAFFTFASHSNNYICQSLQ